MKRTRQNAASESAERYASLIKQFCSKGLERLERSQAVLPIDRLAFLYCLHYLDTSQLNRNSIYTQAQQIVSCSIRRVQRPDLFEDVDLCALMDQIAEEQHPRVVSDTIRELNELEDQRMMLIEVLEETFGDKEGPSSDTDSSQSVERGDDGDEEKNVESDERKYEAREGVPEWKAAEGGELWALCAAYLEANALDASTSTGIESYYLNEVEKLVNSPELDYDGLSSIAASASAIAACTTPEYVSSNATPCGASASKGLDHGFYKLVHAKASLRASQIKLGNYQVAHKIAPLPYTAEQRAFLEAFAAAGQQLGLWGQPAKDSVEEEAPGVALDFVPDERYLLETVLKADDAPPQEDEDFLRDEVPDYYLRKQQEIMRRPNVSSTKPQPAPPLPALVKPHRFCKVKTGFSWNQYNKTHYNSSNNPPPRVVMWYEFTLFYPALVNKKIDWSGIFRIEDVDPGFNDQYCLIVFSVGAPYADVAYRIIRKPWDTRKGGVRSSFDGKGKYKLFFRFANSGYTR